MLHFHGRDNEYQQYSCDMGALLVVIPIVAKVDEPGTAWYYYDM